MLEYKVISYRGDATLEKWLNEMAKQWYSADRVVADSWKCIVVYSRWILTQVTQEDVENVVEETSKDTEEE